MNPLWLILIIPATLIMGFYGAVAFLAINLMSEPYGEVKHASI